MPILFKQVTKAYPSPGGPAFLAVDSLSLTIDDGAFVVLLGESGSGKTTTLKMINRLTEPTSGEIEIDGTAIRQMPAVALRRSIGYAFQGIGLFPHMSVAENIAITPELLGWKRADIDARIDELLELVALPPGTYRDRMPSELSGGQRQRIGFARALAARPKIMLLDEAFGALDPVTRDELRDQFKQIHTKLGLTTILVSHDMAEALILADRILVMRQGRILQDGSPADLVNAPADPYVADLMAAPRHAARALEALEAAP